MRQKQTTGLHSKGMISVLSILLSIAAVASVAACLLYRMMSNRAYHQRWSDYDDCGMA